MIIDCHTHLFDEWRNLKGIAPAEFVAQMDALGIVRACVFTLRGFLNAEGCNDELVELCRTHRDRLVPFCTVNPHQGERAVTELRRSVETLGMKGLKLHPWLQAFSLTNEYFLGIVEETVRLGIPVICHSGSPPYTTPTQFGNLARKFPGARIILGEAGVNDLWREAVHCAAKYSNLYLCIGITPFQALKEMVRRVPLEQLVFGSDLSFSTRADAAAQIDKVRRLGLPAEAEEKLFAGNISSLVDFDS